MAQRKLGQILVDLGYLSEDQLWDILEEQKQSQGEVIGQVALRMGMITPDQLTEALAEQWGMPVVNLEETNIPPKVIELVPQTMALLRSGDSHQRSKASVPSRWVRTPSQ